MNRNNYIFEENRRVYWYSYGIISDITDMHKCI